MGVRNAIIKLGGGNRILPGKKKGSHKADMIHLVMALQPQNAISKVESHYLHKQSNRHYLEGDLSDSKTYRFYCKWFRKHTFYFDPVTQREYKHIPNKPYNINFTEPGKDQWTLCTSHKIYARMIKS
jgi:hypothetical protein